ncbi:unnamed protein product [Staurois parvus]|uniref:Uncharacterized protein n=1 Tax=Staurois parvus TaxID=386267 RepID=A0ABN9BMP4_9NEOB|nr:unnamed protein product [Staurois parvus]
MGPPGNRGSYGPCVLAQTQKSLCKRYGMCDVLLLYMPAMLMLRERKIQRARAD